MMQRVAIKWRTGVRWLTCGWRLFGRNPWLLVPMGGLSAILVSFAAAIPMFGALAVAVLAPILLASALRAIDVIARLKRPLPASLRLPAIGQSLKELFGIFRTEKNLLPIMFFSVFSMIVALLTSMAVLAVVGAAWSKPFASLGAATMFTLLGMSALALVIYVLLAASLVYALPLTFLLDEDVGPAITRSLKTSVRNLVALCPLFLVVVAPFVVAAGIAHFAPLAAYVAQVLVAALAWPVAAAAGYCSYRTLFTIKAGATA